MIVAGIIIPFTEADVNWPAVYVTWRELKTLNKIKTDDGLFTFKVLEILRVFYK